MPSQYHAPTADRAVLAEPYFDTIPALVEANRARLDRARVTIGGLPLGELRARTRREALQLAHADDAHQSPLLLAGHQPELSHPGVWVKNFALNGLAKKLGGVPLNLIVDNDTLKSTSLRFPTFRNHDPSSVRIESLAFDAFSGEVPYEDRAVIDDELFRTFAKQAAPLWANWGYEPLLASVWTPRVCAAERQSHTLGDFFTTLRRKCEHDWGCDNLELRVSQLCQTEAFQLFAAHILRDLTRFHEVYNAAIRSYRNANGVRSANHPAPELAEGEAPFWVRTTTGRRERATPTSDVRALRPRALTLTLFARVCLGDFFIHGIGGGKYDEVTDTIIRDYFGIEPPTYQVLSATLHLPLSGFPATAAEQQRAEQRVRDLRWNPQRHLRPEQRANPDLKLLVDEHAALAAHEPDVADHTARREWFRAFQKFRTRLQPLVAKELPAAEAELVRIQSEAAANAIVRQRDYAWVLYPSELLKPFLTQFV